MDDVVASSSGSMQMRHDSLTSLIKEFEMSDVNDSDVASQIKSLLEASNYVVGLGEMMNTNGSGLDLDSKGMGRYVACQIKDILEFVDAEVGNRHSKKKKREKKKKRGVGGQEQDDDGIGMTEVMQMLLYETMQIYNLLGGWVLDGLKSEDGVIERLSGRSVVLPKVKHFVGMEKDLKQLVSSLTDPQQQQQQQQRVVWVWGVEGLGKTTLAVKVFMHPQVRSHFNACAWVSLTQGLHCKSESILQNIREQLGESSEKKKIASDDKIEQMFDDIQRRKRCLIVIDGIWKIDQWTDISSALLTTYRYSRILVTTRDEKIACPNGKDIIVHNLEKLDENNGWELIKKHASCGYPCPDKGIIPKLGKEMVGKCDNLPLTISHLGRALSKIRPSKWHTVNEDVTRFLKEDDRGKSPSSEHTSFSPSRYDRLRFHLKQCFLYLGIFKQDIDAEDLTFLWAAEGMLFAQQQDKDNKDNATIIDTAERYLQKLNSEGMLKVKVDGLSATRMLPLSLHNDQFDLSRYQGKNKGFGLYVSDHPVDDIEQILSPRRLVFHFNKQVTSSLTDAMKSKHIQSLFFINSDQEYVDLPVSMSNFEKLKLLRIVHFVKCKFKDRKLPEEIEKLVRLRYLGIIYCDLDKLPSSISKSGTLHVLNVRAYDDAKMTVPNIFSHPSQLSQMKHLRLPRNLEKEKSKSDKRLKLDGLRDLETLVGFNVHVHDIDSLSNLKKLRLLVAHVGNNASLTPIIKLVEDKGPTVQIHVVVENKCNFTSPDELPDLEEMLMCHQLYALTFSMVHIHEFPNCGAHSSSGLTQIKLIECKLPEDPMEALGKFPSLRKLCLGYGAFVGSKIEIRYHHDGGFKHLEYLEFRCFPNLEKWLVDSGAMPSLSTLTVKRCPKLKEIPQGLTSVSSLNNFEIELPLLSIDKKKEYKKMFSSVENFTIR